MQKDATYYRARLDAIAQIISEEKGGDRTEKNNHSVLLRNGIVPEALKERYDKAFSEHHKAWSNSGNYHPLTFSEITRFNTWFEIHPEKVAGKEIITTSREFPISIKGSDTTILMAITKTLQSKDTGPEQNERPVDFSFTASNITVYDAKTGRILAQSIHDSESLIRLLKKFPNFTDRLGMYARLTGYYSDVPMDVRMAFFKNDKENTPNFPGNQKLEFENQNRLSEYLDRFGDPTKTPISRTMITLKSGDDYFWTNKAEWEEPEKKQVPIRYDKVEKKQSMEEKNKAYRRLRIVKAKATAKLKLLELLRM
jgi:hypothetical protein